MKNLKLLNKKYLLIILFFLSLGLSAQSQEPVDIWSMENTSITIFISVILLNKIDFPSPNKDVEKNIPNENLKIVK